MSPLFTKEAFTPPAFANRLTRPPPPSRVSLGLLPTPLHPWRLPGAADIDLHIKRDDLSGSLLSGNKVRKLEFLLATALDTGATCVCTVGGIQSNHARATAVAARYLGLDAHLILRTAAALVDRDPGVAGNLLPSRVTGARLHLVSKEEYAKEGGNVLLARLERRLVAAGQRPYVIPVGGSNAVGAWGYLSAAAEIVSQSPTPFDAVILATGSGGTLAGLALGLRLAGWTETRVLTFCVCDTPDYFYDVVQTHLDELGAPPGANDARNLVTVVQARGAGYAVTRPEEAETLASVAAASGVVLDPVYTSKAVHTWLADVAAHPDEWRGKRVLFLHTGGLLGALGAGGDLSAVAAATGPAAPLGPD